MTVRCAGEVATPPVLPWAVSELSRTNAWVPLADGAVDLLRRRVRRDGGEAHLTAREADLLAYLWGRAGDLVSREELLVEVWNYRASRPTRAVDLAISRLRRKIEQDPSEPVHLLSTYGEGYQFVPPVRSSPQAAPMPRPSGPPTNIVPAGSPMRGRDDLARRVAARLAEGGRLVTLVGPGGVGKTRLAREVGLREVTRRPGGVWFCDLAGAPTLGDVVQGVATAAGVPLAGHGDAEDGVAQVAWALASREPTLLVLDNLEQVRRPAGRAIVAWLGRVEHLVVLATSRERLHLDGESLVEVAPLAESDATRVFTDRYAALHDAPPEDDALVPGIVGRLDGLPLALELAASRTRTLSLAQLAARLDDRFALLRDPSGRHPSRHATLTAVLDGSWHLLDPSGQRLLAWLAVFRDGFDLDAVEAVCAEDDPSAPWPLDVLVALREASLVTMHPDGDRYGLLETVREYAARRLAETGEEAEARRRHAAWYAERGERLLEGTRGPAVVERLEDLERTRHNLVVAFAHAQAPREVARLALVLARLARSRGPGGLEAEVLDSALARTEGVADPLRCRLLVERAGSRLRREEPEDAARDVEAAVQLAAALGARVEEALALARRAELHDWYQRTGEAIADGERAVAGLREAGAEHEAARTLADLAELYADAGRLAEAEDAATRSLLVFEGRAARWHATIVRIKWSAIAASLGRLAEARARAAQAVEVLEDLRDASSLVIALTSYVAEFAAMSGDLEEAARCQQRAWEVARRAGLPTMAMSSLFQEIESRLGLGQVAVASARLQVAAELAPGASGGLFARGPVVGPTLRLLEGLVAFDAGRRAEALAALREGLAGCRAHGSAVARADAAARVGWVLLEIDEPAEAAACFVEAAAQAQEAGLDLLRGVALGGQAVAAARNGDAAGAARLCEAARDATGHPLLRWMADGWEPLVHGLAGGAPVMRGDDAWLQGPIPWIRIAPFVAVLRVWRTQLDRLCDRWLG